MECPDCGYVMTPFDKECPRCEKMGERMRDRSARNPYVAHQNRQGAERYGEEHEAGPVGVPHSVPASAETAVEAAVEEAPVPPAPIATSNLLPGSILFLFGALIVGVLCLLFSAGAPAGLVDQRQAIIDAAAEGLPAKLGQTGPVTQHGHDYWVQQAHEWKASIVMDGDNRAEVTFYDDDLKPPLDPVMDHEVVARDTDGEWHAQ